MTDQIRVVATRKEDGCLSNVLHRDVSDAALFAFIGACRDQAARDQAALDRAPLDRAALDRAALDRHMGQPQLQALVEFATPILQQKRVVTVFKEIA